MPPVRNAAATRERLLACARQRFLQESYENVALREIAGDAGVDVALVGRYFGSKEQLFKDVLRKNGDLHELAAGAEDLPSFLADLATAKGAAHDDGHIERLLIMLRSASSPQASALVRSSFNEDVLGPLASLIHGPEAHMRAAIAMSILMGTTIVRTILNLGALTNCDGTAFKSRLRKLLATALAED